jgi:hypothetical protein
MALGQERRDRIRVQVDRTSVHDWIPVERVLCPSLGRLVAVMREQNRLLEVVLVLTVYLRIGTKLL